MVSPYAPFRSYLKNIKDSCRKKSKKYRVTLTDLKNLWESQNGICPYTGWKLIHTNELNPNKASVDRIDSAKGYFPGNIQFVALIANYAKSTFTENQLLEFCSAVAENKDDSGNQED
jgi:hypothetical protein